MRDNKQIVKENGWGIFLGIQLLCYIFCAQYGG